QIVQARQLGVPVIGEVELAARFLRGKIIAITGSNGKTTTTTLVGEILEQAGKEVQVGGNIGMPVVSMVSAASEQSYNVLEISSFQLETIQQFHPRVAAILNVTADHLDRHRSMESYIAAKARIFENQTPEDFAVLNADDSICVSLAGKTHARILWFSRKSKPQQGSHVRDGKIRFCGQAGEAEIMPVSEIPLKGAHNLENVLAAVCVARAVDCSPAVIRKAVKDFQAVSTGWNSWPPSTALIITTIPKLPTSMPPSRRWNHFQQIFIWCSAAKIKAATTPCSKPCCARE